MLKFLTLCIAGILLTPTACFAANPPIIWGSPYAKLLLKGIQVSGSDTTTTCNAATAGSIRYNAGTFQGCDGSGWYSMNAAAAAGASTTLNNLGTTAINADLIFDSALTTATIKTAAVAGKNLLMQSGAQTANASATGNTTVTTGNSTGTTSWSGSTYLTTGTGTAGGTGNVYVNSGNATNNGPTGDVIISTGTTGGTRGKIRLQEGSEGTSGQVWTSTGTLGEGHWAAASSGPAKWFVAAYLNGANPSLGVTDVDPYAEISDSALTLTPITNSAAAGVMCSSTNAATSPSTSPTTCAAGNEVVGISFAIPASGGGVYEVCFDIELNIQIDASESMDVAFTVMETPTDAQTNTLDGGPHISTSASQQAGGDTDHQWNQAMHICGDFDWSAKAANDVVGVRLLYEQIKGGSPDTVRIFADNLSSLGNRSIFIRAKRLY